MRDGSWMNCSHRSGLLIIAAILIVIAGPIAESRSADKDLRITPLVRAVANAKPSVVNIRGRKQVRQSNSARPSNETFRQVNGMGTGVVVDQRGYIVTNYHVVHGVAKIQISFADKRTYIGRLIAHDPKTDLAVLKIDVHEPLPVIKIGNSSDLMQAETVVAVGNAFGYEHTVTRGVISELHRTVQVSDDQIYYDLIQTDASINPGNSGGPLLNINGEMIGINVAVRVGAQGIGFAIPVNRAIDVVARLIKQHNQQFVDYGFQGETIYTDNSPAYLIKSVAKESPAEKAGLTAGDVVTAINGRQVSHSLDVEKIFLGHQPGDEFKFEIRRGPQTVNTNFVVQASTTRTTPQTATDVAWELLGVKLALIPANEFRRYGSRYRGGMTVVDVRPNGPAATEGIQAGDVLVGMHVWETISFENLRYILTQPEVKQANKIKFYILRGRETLWGHIRVASATR